MWTDPLLRISSTFCDLSGHALQSVRGTLFSSYTARNNQALKKIEVSGRWYLTFYVLVLISKGTKMPSLGFELLFQTQLNEKSRQGGEQMR